MGDPPPEDELGDLQGHGEQREVFHDFQILYRADNGKHKKTGRPVKGRPAGTGSAYLMAKAATST